MKGSTGTPGSLERTGRAARAAQKKRNAEWAKLYQNPHSRWHKKPKKRKKR